MALIGGAVALMLRPLSDALQKRPALSELWSKARMRDYVEFVLVNGETKTLERICALVKNSSKQRRR